MLGMRGHESMSALRSHPDMTASRAVDVYQKVNAEEKGDRAKGEGKGAPMEERQGAEGWKGGRLDTVHHC